MSSKKGSKTSTWENIGSVLSPIITYGAMAATGRSDKFKHTTMGRMFQQPSTKFPETKGASSAQAVADAASESAMMAAKEKEKKRLRGAAGRSSLIATSGRGVLEPAETGKKKLLGQ